MGCISSFLSVLVTLGCCDKIPWPKQRIEEFIWISRSKEIEFIVVGRLGSRQAWQPPLGMEPAFSSCSLFPVTHARQQKNMPPAGDQGFKYPSLCSHLNHYSVKKKKILSLGEMALP